jgi:DNA-binding NtrC family response regulator
MSEYNTILYISDDANSSNSAVAALEKKGYEVVTTNSSTEGIALLYVMHSVAAVVLDTGARQHADFDLAQSLEQIRPHVPVIVLCGDQIHASTEWTHTCVKKDKLASALQYLLTIEPVAS